MKLIQTKDYLLLIDEEAEIKTDDYVLSLINKPIIIDVVTESDEESINGNFIKWTNRKHCAKIIAYYPLTKEAKELDLPLLPNPNVNKDIDVEELACNIYGLSLDEYEYIKENLSQNRELIEEHYRTNSR